MRFYTAVGVPKKSGVARLFDLFATAVIANFQDFYADDERSERRYGERDATERRHGERDKTELRYGESDTPDADTVKAVLRHGDIKRSAVGGAPIREFFPCPFSGL